MVQGFFYNSVGGDRKYNGNSVNESKRPFYKDGVFAGHMEVTAKGEGMKIVVDGGEKTGFAWINAHKIHNTTPLEIDISQASGTLNRIDRVVLRNDEIERKPTIYVLEGAFSSAPVAPELTNTDTIQEKCLAEINVKAGAVEITQADITDTRADVNLCGFVASQFQEFDFSQWQKQFDTYFAALKKQYGNDYKAFTEAYAAMTASFMNTQEAEWNAWFQNKQDELAGDVAGKLQLQIDDAMKHIHNMALKLYLESHLEQITAAITVTLTNKTTGTKYAQEVTGSGIAFYITEAGEYTVESSLESVMITPKAFTVTNVDLMTQKTLAMREGSNLGYIGNYIGAYIAQ